MKKLSQILAISILTFFCTSTTIAECRLTNVSTKRKTTIKGDCSSEVYRRGVCAGGGCYFSPTNFEQTEALSNTISSCTANFRLRQIRIYKGDCKRTRRVKKLSGITIHLFENVNSVEEENPNLVSEVITNKRGVAKINFNYNETSCYYQARRLKKNSNSLGRHLLGISTLKSYEEDTCFK